MVYPPRSFLLAPLLRISSVVPVRLSLFLFRFGSTVDDIRPECDLRASSNGSRS